ncbi:hypothetical protein [Cytobacillus purgationiresistens]|uniref:Ion transporter superfamily protein YfcC n=1 Tax=Cytobacillus purgationiresistens TaxID=863449 RepID=A0ABU0AC10_9BACI|nr:hypothetical protein [Cytobacillus purgationiresistens]MDQ0268251.1 putative ion transporter superfamily protein YfcC [Cytobacillus purgationiresistens]
MGLVATVLFVYRYAKKTKANPDIRFFGHFHPNESKNITLDAKLETRHKWELQYFF